MSSKSKGWLYSWGCSPVEIHKRKKVAWAPTYMITTTGAKGVDEVLNAGGMG